MWVNSSQLSLEHYYTLELSFFRTEIFFIDDNTFMKTYSSEKHPWKSLLMFSSANTVFLLVVFNGCRGDSSPTKDSVFSSTIEYYLFSNNMVHDLPKTSSLHFVHEWCGIEPQMFHLRDVADYNSWKVWEKYSCL